MNNSCPNCGAIYNVAAKDVGRKIKCKKCATALVVTEGGLEVDDPDAVAPPASRPAPVGAEDDAEVVDAPARKPKRTASSAGFSALNPVQIFKDFGGVASILFGSGAFLVIVFLFMPLIGQAAVQRAEAAKDKLEQEKEGKIKKLIPKGKQLGDLTEDEKKRVADDTEKIRKDYEKQISDAEDDARSEKITNRRAAWYERYFTMFGFVLLMAGSLGFMMPGQPGIRRVVGAVVLTSQMVLVFLSFLIRSSAVGVGG